ncbi:MAG: hypothetical protein Q4C91_21930, partial [Eubacteriales bacterium]|nr:hypothetical protein [Eubacteriales bacterium]
RTVRYVVWKGRVKSPLSDTRIIGGNKNKHSILVPVFLRCGKRQRKSKKRNRSLFKKGKDKKA